MKGRGDQKIFISSTPTLALPHRRGRGFLVKIETIFLKDPYNFVFAVHALRFALCALRFAYYLSLVVSILTPPVRKSTWRVYALPSPPRTTAVPPFAPPFG